ncbi:stromelysin-2-like [Arctopsyche grandis]|uniref:stromelysin-2-like n=1 Tax=Arctopsyche grandis TaxID=121162 RepID=UPI00406D7FA5
MEFQKTLLLLWSICLISTVVGLDLKQVRAIKYLKKYGYIEDVMKTDCLVDETVLENALREFQTYVNLDTTGKLDAETISKMDEYRCGNKDKTFNKTIQHLDNGSGVIKWKSKSITYTVKDSFYLKKKIIDDEVLKAFNFWGRHMNIVFSQVQHGADIEIRFVKTHPSFGAFSNHVFGTTSYPGILGKIYVKDDWKTLENLYHVLVHQIGHVLGLEHENSSSIMFPIHNSEQSNIIKADDSALETIKNMYEEQSSNLNSLCYVDSIDAIFTTSDKAHTYVFKDKHYWKISDGKLVPEHPKLISNRWPLVDGPITAIYQDENEFTFIFKDYMFWKYLGDLLIEGYPKIIKDVFPESASHIKAFFKINNNIYIFKNDYLYIYQKNLNSLNMKDYELLSQIERKQTRNVVPDNYREMDDVYPETIDEEPPLNSFSYTFPKFDTISYINGENEFVFINGTKYIQINIDLLSQLTTEEITSSTTIKKMFGCVLPINSEQLDSQRIDEKQQSESWFWGRPAKY